MNHRGQNKRLGKYQPPQRIVMTTDFEETRIKVLQAYTVQDLDDENLRHFIEGRLTMTDMLIKETHQ